MEDRDERIVNEEINEMVDAKKNEEQEERLYPAIPLRGVSVLPHTVVHFDVGRDKSLKALELAMESDKMLAVFTQMDDNVLIPTEHDIYAIGTLVRVKQMLKISGDAVRVLVEGLDKIQLSDVVDEQDAMFCKVDVIPEDVEYDMLSVEDKAAISLLSDRYAQYAAITGQISDDTLDSVLQTREPAAMVNKLIISLRIDCHRKQALYETVPFYEKVRKLIILLTEENDIAMEEKKLSKIVKDNIDESQKEYFLKEKIRAIQQELGEDEDVNQEAEKWAEKLKELGLDEKIEAKIMKEINRFSKMNSASAESAVIRSYIETILDLPWNTSSKTNTNLKKAEKILNQDHYGLDKIKERILEYLAVIQLSKVIKGPILCLVGPPGVGKTSIAKSVARATGREFVRMSLGGVRDEAEIRGHRRTYIGAIPGNVITSLRTCGTNNPVFLFDEVDKIGSDFKGDPASALLEVLDPEQNNTFMDHYLEIPFDLSKVLFITTANTASTIPRPLLDRMEVIEVSGYTEEEKVKIAQKYLVDKQIKANGMKPENIKISEGALRDIINYYTRESGVRTLEREIAGICRKMAKSTVTTKKKTYSVTGRNLESYLGKKKFHYDKVEGESQVGVVTGMAWTSVGGETLSVESVILPGTGKLQLTGQLGDVMQESARAGVSYIRSIADTMDIDQEFYKDKDIHIHVPEGAVPKDGPSAGVTIFTSVVSALTNKPVRMDVSMTGEITLRGKVLPVGGIKEKVLAAHRAGIKKILLPKENLVDLDEIPSSVKRQLEFVGLEYAKEALDHALVQ